MNLIRLIAVLLTCHNRKDKTITCLNNLIESKKLCINNFDMDVYLTDDGSSDGTSSEIRKKFPFVNILEGNGNLFWAGGMRFSWNEALNRKCYDAFFLLNDDTMIEQKCFDELFNAHNYSLERYGTGGIYVGSVRDRRTLEHTYGGSLILNKWAFTFQSVIPNGAIQECQCGNGNIMLVHKNVVEAIGILSEKYIHGKADYDYTMRAFRKKLPILVCSNYCGFCTNDHPPPNFRTMSLQERIKYLKMPSGTEISGYMYFMWRFFPVRAPFVYISLWLKTIFPSSIRILNRIKNRPL